MEPENPYQRPDSYPKINFSFTDQYSQSIRRFQFNVPYFEQARAVKINQVINQLMERGFFQEAQFFLYDHINRMKMFLGIFPPNDSDIMIQTQHIIGGDSLHLSYKEVRRQPNSQGMMQQTINSGCLQDGSRYLSKQNTKRKKQARQRTIDEAVESVKQWRTLYDTADDNGKRLYTLDEAAEKVGIPKKTLDDYFMKIRLAAKYDFHFEKMKNHKFGLLRNFVKTAKQEGIQKLREKFPQCLLDNDINKYWINFDLL